MQPLIQNKSKSVDSGYEKVSTTLKQAQPAQNGCWGNLPAVRGRAGKLAPHGRQPHGVSACNAMAGCSGPTASGLPASLPGYRSYSVALGT